MKIQILGTGHCSKCAQLYDFALDAVKELSLEAEVVKIDDMIEIVSMGVLSTPGIAVDGKVISSGRVIGKDRIIELLKQAI